MRAVHRRLDATLTERGLFRRSLRRSQLWSVGQYIPPLLLLIAIQMGPRLLATSRPLLPVLAVAGFPLVVLMLVTYLYGHKGATRTADGSAAYAQAIGFREYLKTAEADRLRWEEGVDIFSRYLPYAVAFGCADRWTRVFQELAARGQYQMQPTWYVSPAGVGFAAGADFSSSMSSMVSGLNGVTTAATVGSSGGSGFSSSSSGGGGGGGGVGGGGGGSW